ncbi:MAG: AAA family ATPase [Deltaproteobacteria bacterium]|nr:AAA family ATPase [Deltaproteobacteria bacterium]
MGTRRIPRIVREEQRLLDRVLAALASGRGSASGVDYAAELVQMRDHMAAERLPDDQAIWLDQMDRLAAVAAARARRSARPPDASRPYFAHMRLALADGAERDILLGKQTFVRGGIRIVDWRHAPICRVFYRYREGDPFSERIAGRTLEGELAVRRCVTVAGGKLLRVSSPQRTYLLDEGGWREAGQCIELAGGAGSASRPDTALRLGGGAERALRADKRLPEIAALLDAEQYEVLTTDGERLLVVTGGAGSGKTTVALHRLAFLTFQDPARFRPGRMLVLVFGRALERYISRVLPALGVEGVEVQTLDAWARSARQRHFPGTTRHVSESPPAAVVRFKTHLSLLRALEQAALDAPGADPLALFDELFTDRGWLAASAAGAFRDGEIDEIHRWCTEQQFGRADGGRQDEPPCYDELDDMILLRLYQLLRGRLRYSVRRGLSYDHLVVDEVQDFSPLELRVLLETVRGSSVTLAGDPAQRLSDSDFGDPAAVLESIGVRGARIASLQVSYRSTRQIMTLADEVLGSDAPAAPCQAARSGEPVEFLRFAGRGEAMTFLADALTDLTRREPLASVAVLTPETAQAVEAFRTLQRSDLEGLRLVSDQDFCFGPGIEVCEVAQTKGLEFDYALLLHVDAQSYPDTPTARRSLHVGLTRAVHQAWLLGWGRTSPTLPDRLGGRRMG